jgi:hypothetical protein
MGTTFRFGHIAALFAFAAAGSALAADLPKEGHYDFVSCYAGVDSASVNIDSTHAAVIRDYTGTNKSTIPGTLMDMTSFHCVALVNRLTAKVGSTSICEVTDKDGDHIYTRFVGDGGTSESSVVAGTGKYAGMERNGITTMVGNFPTAKAGTFQTCVKQTGTYKLK